MRAGEEHLYISEKETDITLTLSPHQEGGSLVSATTPLQYRFFASDRQIPDQM